ncbi:DUF6777 domain-containing protein [Actinomadura montaniterrae]|uniref:DUF6777 domain-containing protein n=1 Tax=Actinomadura montaniterrae TaxID=1803903 RepID=A0A6L3VZ98_9ACTN|nr:DUF6777 domain-containing protein [Actinomadura montaniterrae]KAB2379362.1 hypothetical protein F9B16_20845 [Actinomadura montaniterrae]
MLEINSRMARGRLVITAAGALVLAAGTLAGCGDAGAAITRLTVGSPGPDPYTLAANTDQAKVTTRPARGGTKDGDAPGLYGGTRRISSCDQRRLVTFLQANPDKARAWARVQGIPVSDIARYVSRLTPVLLRTDTLVTNHGYRDGRATSAAAVLQAGMGVLVNGYGMPAVKCNCGNPLTAPEGKIKTSNARYSGRKWPGFEKRNVTRIRPRDSRKGTITVFVLVDPGATMGFERPRATAGGDDGPPQPLPPTETAPPSDSPAPVDSGDGSSGSPVPGDGSPDPGSPEPGSPEPGTSGPGSPGAGSPGPEISQPGVSPGGEPGTGTTTGTGTGTGDGTGDGGTGGATGGAGTPGDEPQSPVISMAPPGPSEGSPAGSPAAF